MIIFKTGVKIIRKNALTLSIYIVAFLMLSIFIDQFSNSSSIVEFAEIRPSFSLINRDEESEVISGLKRFLTTRADEVVLEDDQKILIDANVYGTSDCIFLIPDGFSQSVISGEMMMLEKLSARGSSDAYWMSGLVDQYLHVFEIYHEMLPDVEIEEISEMVLENLSIDAEVEMKNTPETKKIAFLSFFEKLGYITLMLMILIVSTVMMSVQRPELRMRNLSSPVSNKNQNLQIMLCIFFVCLVAWFFLIVSGILLHREALVFDFQFLLIVVNSFVFLLVSIGVAFLVSVFIKGSSAQNFAANIISLAFSFLGGIFIPLDFLGEQVLRISRFLPTYWYVTVLHRINDAGKIDFISFLEARNLMDIRNGMMMQIGFAVTFFIVGLAVSRVKLQTGHDFSTIKTQIN